MISKLDGSLEKVRITKLFSFSGLKRVDIEQTELGDIVAIAGVAGITIGETITSAEANTIVTRVGGTAIITHRFQPTGP